MQLVEQQLPPAPLPSLCSHSHSSQAVVSSAVFQQELLPHQSSCYFFPPEASKGSKSTAMCKYWSAVCGGLVTWQLKYLTYILLSTSKVRWSCASSQNFFPKEFHYCGYFGWNRLLLNIKGRAQGLGLWGCARAGPLSRDFGVAGSF